MPKALMVVFTDPKGPEAEEQYNKWYTDVHVPEVLETPGFVAVTRYKVTDSPGVPGAGSEVQRYLALWEIEADDVAAAAKALQEQAVKDGWGLGEGIDPMSISMRFFEPITERITKE